MALNAPYTSNTVIESAKVSDDLVGLSTGANDTTANKLSTFRDEAFFDFIISGLVWGGDSYGVNLNASMSAGSIVIDGVRTAVTAVTARAFTASRDTYIDINSSGTITYTEVTNNAASPALAANNMRIGIIVTGASTIANAGSVNQGQEDKVLPIASSIPYAFTDSIGNIICPRDPNRKILAYRRVGDLSTTSGTAVQITGLSIPMNALPTNRKIKVILILSTCITSGNNNIGIVVYDGTVPSGTKIAEATLSNTAAGAATNLRLERVFTPSSASATFNAGFYINGGSTFSTNGDPTQPAHLSVELV